MSLNILGRVRGAASLHYKGQDFWTKDVAAFGIDLKPFKVKSDAQGAISMRAGGRLVTVTFTPVGVWTAAQLAVLYPFLNARQGDFNTPIRQVTAVNTGTSALTSANHGQLNGTGIRFGVQPGVVLPTGLAPATTYYLFSPDGNTIYLYDTEAHALASVDGTTPPATGLVAITSAGTGTPSFIVNTPLTITTTDGQQLTIWNAAITVQPSLNLTSVETPFKQITIEGYTRHGMQWSDANSLFSYQTGVIGATPPAQAQIPTVGYTIDWATRQPITGDSTVTNTLTVPNHGFTIAQPLTVDDLSTAGTLPAPLAVSTTYYVIVVDVNTIKLATTGANATGGTAIPLTSAGSGTIDVVSLIEVLGLQPREAIDLEFPVTWADVPADADGITCRSVSEVMARVGFVPTNLDAGTLFNAINVQGTATSGRGQNLPTANLDIYGPEGNPFIRVYAAALQNDPLRFGSQADRVDKLQFETVRAFLGINARPVAALGIAAPTS